MFPLRFKKIERGEAERRAREIAGARAHRRAARPAPEPAFGRPAAARRAGARAGQAAAPAAARRAAVEPRRVAAPVDAHRDPPHPARVRRHDDPRHARPDRGDDDGRPHRRDERGPGRAGGHGQGPLRAPGDAVRRELHRLAADQPVRRSRARRRSRFNEAQTCRCRRPCKATSCWASPGKRARRRRAACPRGSSPSSRWAAKCSIPPSSRSASCAFSRRARTRATARATTLRSRFAAADALLFDKKSGQRLDLACRRLTAARRRAGCAHEARHLQHPVRARQGRPLRPRAHRARKCADADVIALQEVDRHWQRSGCVDSPAVLARSASRSPLGLRRQSRHGRELSRRRGAARQPAPAVRHDGAVAPADRVVAQSPAAEIRNADAAQHPAGRARGGDRRRGARGRCESTRRT